MVFERVVSTRFNPLPGQPVEPMGGGSTQAPRGEELLVTLRDP